MFINTDHEEATQFPMEHDGVPQLHICPARHTYSNVVEETGEEIITRSDH